MRIVVDDARVLVDERVMRALVGRVLLRHRQVHSRVAIEPLGRRDQRKVRRHERNEQHPRLAVVARRFLVQPDLRARRDVAVVDRVGRLARSGVLRHLLAALAHRDVVAHQPLHVAEALDDVHRHDLLGEAVVVARASAKMQLADRHDAMTRPAQRVMPARYRAVVGVAVVPEADLVHITPGRERGPRRHADRTGRVRLRESRAARRERVEVRRGDVRMAARAEELRVVLVGHQHEHVGGGVHLRESAVPSPRNTGRGSG